MNITERKEDDQRKNDFIAMVSHELKTPVTSLKGYLQMLEIKTKNNTDVFIAGAIEKANKQVTKMTAMINGFLNTSRLESGKIQIDRQRFDLAELIRESEEDSIASVSSHYVVYAPVEITFVNADRDKIGQVITNLISNAVKYSPAGSTINVACISINNCATVSVKDAGAGIPDRDKARLFERFYRVQNDSTKAIVGFGIGLYLCSEIVERHDGKIWVESEPGKGSTFYFTLPIDG